MYRRISVRAVFIATAFAVVLAWHGSASACDRVVVRAAATHDIAVAPLAVVTGTNSVPLAVVPATVARVTVAPVTVVPFDAAPLFVSVQAHTAKVRSARAAVVRPLLVRPNRARSVTRARTVVR